MALQVFVQLNIVYVILCYRDDGSVLATLESGDFFGEIGVLNLDGTSNK